MGFEVVVEDELGNKVASFEDPKNILHSIFPTQDDINYRCLNRVDWYGDTTFNRNQIPDVRKELECLVKTRRNAEELTALNILITLAIQCETGSHLYLKFYGD